MKRCPSVLKAVDLHLLLLQIFTEVLLCTGHCSKQPKCILLASKSLSLLGGKGVTNPLGKQSCDSPPQDRAQICTHHPRPPPHTAPGSQHPAAQPRTLRCHINSQTPKPLLLGNETKWWFFCGRGGWRRLCHDAACDGEGSGIRQAWVTLVRLYTFSQAPPLPVQRGY